KGDLCVARRVFPVAFGVIVANIQSERDRAWCARSCLWRRQGAGAIVGRTPRIMRRRRQEYEQFVRPLGGATGWIDDQRHPLSVRRTSGSRRTETLRGSSETSCKRSSL